MIWIIGEYAERIDNADELLESFVEGFQDENSQVQLQLLTAVVKLFLKRPQNTQELVQSVLTLSTQVSTSHFKMAVSNLLLVIFNTMFMTAKAFYIGKGSKVFPVPVIYKSVKFCFFEVKW